MKITHNSKSEEDTLLREDSGLDTLIFWIVSTLGRNFQDNTATDRLTIAQDAELLDLAVESGCRGLFVGLESLSNESLSKVGKGFCLAETYLEGIENLHRAGIAVEAGIIFGFDEDSQEVFDRTLDFLKASHIELAQITVLTPLPGTAIYNQLEREGRILTKDWSYYDFFHVVFQPKKMTPEDLQTGTDEVVRRFYSTRKIMERTISSLHFLGFLPTLGTILPLNLGACLTNTLGPATEVYLG